jgi:hypothetical protein
VIVRPQGEEALAYYRLLQLRKKNHEDSVKPPPVRQFIPKWCYKHNTITVRNLFVYSYKKI